MLSLACVVATVGAFQSTPWTRAPTQVTRGGALEAAKNSAFVFVKPHAITEPTIELVRSKLGAAGVEILGEGDIASEEIDEKQLIDQHYYALASKATQTPPAELAMDAGKFKDFFGEEWADVLKDGRAVTAIDACKRLGCDGAALDEKWGAAKGAGDIVKLGGGFYCGKLEGGLYTFNAFFMSMRDRFTQPGGKIHYFSVAWDAADLSWADFRGTLLGPTDPSAAPPASIRGTIFSDWKDLGLKTAPNTCDNGVHASASPFEGLAERMNWLGVAPVDDPFGSLCIDAGLTDATIKDWVLDPVVGGGSLFDALEDSDVGPCLSKLGELNAL